MKGRRYCYWIDEVQDPKTHGGYVPSVVYENESGHRPLSGDPSKLQAPWIWGQTLAEAQETARKKNERLGLSEEDAFRIVGSSMGAAR